MSKLYGDWGSLHSLINNAKYEAVVLFSGGVDSTVVATMMARAGVNAILIFVHTGVQTHEDAAIKIAKVLQFPLVTMDLRKVFGVVRDATTPYVAGYRLWLYLAAVSAADHFSAFTIYTGEVAFPDDKTNEDWRADCSGSNDITQEAWRKNRQRFIELYSDMYENQSDAYDFVDPLWGLSKAQIVKLGKALGAPLELTSSCQSRTLDRLSKKNCGICWACKSRIRAGVEENDDQKTKS